MISRLASGIPGLDEVLGGGLLAANSYLLVGDHGTGKTISSLQWLVKGEGGRGLYISLSEPEDNVERTLGSLGWDASFDSIDLHPTADEADAEMLAPYHVFPPSDVERTSIWERIFGALEEHKPRRFVLDSLTQLRYLSPDAYQFRQLIRMLVAHLYRHDITSVFTFETTTMHEDAAVALACDCVLRLRRDVSEHRVVGVRSLEVEKHRRSDYRSGYHSMRISEGGVEVFPHRVEDPGEAQDLSATLGSGVAGLDAQLQGGLEIGTTTIISGQSGVGKTSLAVQFAAEAVRNDLPAIVFTFEESRGSIISRSRSLGIDFDALLEAGSLAIERVNPMELYPDEFLQILRRAVEDDGRRFVVLDSLRGYSLAMTDVGTPVSNLHNMVSYLTRMRVTSILTSEIESLTGSFIPTEMGVSYIADNLLLLRYAEDGDAGQVRRVISCVKKRHGPFERSLRPFDMTDQGLYVGDQLAHVRGMLASAPQILHSGVS